MSESHAKIQLFQDARNQLGIILKQLAEIAAERGDVIIDNQSAAAKIADTRGDFQRKLADMLNERSQNVLAKTAFRLAVIGEFNTGKSTLINALLERKVLSTSIKPKTAAKTILRYGEKDAYRVTYNKKYAHQNSLEIIPSNNLAEDIETVTSDNADVLLKGEGESVATQIKEVEIWCDSEFLNREETEIIDTPGLGSVFESHKTVTYNLIPEMDATLVLFPSDPGLGEDDRILLNFIRQHISQLLFIMTKIDYLSDEDQQQMLDYSREVIENVAKIPVNRVYGVSAKYQMQGQKEDSGFDTLVEGLESFLVSSRGVARLKIPFEVAQTECENLYKKTQVEMQRLDNDVQTLQAELQRLKETQIAIEKDRETLIKKVDQKMESIIASALDGIDNLPTLAESAVDKALDGSNKESLKKADLTIQPIITSTVEEWVNDKERSFRNQSNLLQELVQSELKRFVELVDDTMQLKLPSSTSSAISTPDTSTIGSGRGGRLVWETATQAGGAFVTGAGALVLTSTVATMVTGSLVLFPPLLLILPPLLPLLSHLANSEKRIRQDVKNQLKQPIPKNKVTIFEAIVEGYVDQDGDKQPGMREKLQKHFTNWGKNLKVTINNFVANLVGSQLTQLENQIKDKENNRFDREKNLKMHTKHLENLQKINKQIADLNRTIQSMSSDNGE
ncbi:MAG: dynamin family protein [Aulosira sp. DedQUE10]|nr:dynamin family protein [Aulosira sp. DedQUE10]